MFRKEVLLLLFLIILVSAHAQCIHEVETGCSGCIKHNEIMGYIDLWKSGQSSLPELMEAISAWKNTC